MLQAAVATQHGSSHCYTPSTCMQKAVVVALLQDSWSVAVADMQFFEGPA